MRHDPLTLSVQERVEQLNKRYAHHGATAVLERALGDPQVGRIGLVSSFGAESVVLLHMISVMDRNTPVVFIDTQMLFAETLEYQLELTERLNLTNVQTIRAADTAVAKVDPDGTLHQRDTDACCALRKTQPLQEALSGFDAWITGRKRFQAGSRATLDFFENEDNIRIKVNPLAHWAPEDLQEYMDNNRLPRHPLVAKGYPSIGCAPCTSPVAPGEDPRSGRWRGQDKVECGIHFVNGKMVRGPLPVDTLETAAKGAAAQGEQI
ncbi:MULTISPECIES: phosphoadenylyl-sulfate reductase [Halocynthiibacter]|uniref:Adenosine 5'-phosphosulfate reductase n=1 Tax=Halocynthiibacter halioticoli TaxID=2986804 RepID=A0AAE3LUL2_9RHOB|nr:MULTISPECIES: phosphoadenylyl-sulfate reductase [Halocynthiibacter]MCV6824640.1 phosphoadenylyl-sulfate reductase [Halocynthiibacter halioticoli]MCW4057641.1 phosphoadenylyl-sulfate reductase [Halocynthiibacter sp. SDUM655004]